MSESLRRSEEYPLLTPDAKGDKPEITQQPVIPIECNVTCSPKRPSWISRWPQFVSACWMSVVLVVILFVIFYAFGSIYRLQSMLSHKQNDSKPAAEVHYHYVLPRDNSVPFKTFTSYLSFMATKYPLLNFNVHLLIDDRPQRSFYFPPRNSISLLRFKRFIPKYSGPIGYVPVQNNDRDIENIRSKHRNVIVAVKSMSKYMAKTPLHQTWRSVPVTCLPLYLKAYEVWKNGGIGLNLLTQHYRFNAFERVDFKIDTILKEHSKSVDVSKYSQTLENIDAQDERELLAFAFDAFNEIPKIIFRTFNNLKVVSDNEDVHGLPMTSTKIKRSTTSNNAVFKNATHNDTKMNASNVNETKGNHSEASNTTQIRHISNINMTDNRQSYSGITKEIENPYNTVHWYHDEYELSRLMDEIAEFYEIGNVDRTPDFRSKRNYKNYLTLDVDGSVMAAYSRNHPFLFQLLSTPMFLKHTPRYIIQDTVRRSCFRYGSVNKHSAEYCYSMKIMNNL